MPKKIYLTEQVSAVLQHQTPPKLKDPGTPIISCVIGDITVERALLDLGASVNILPGFFYDKFGLKEMKPTPMTLQLADRSIKVPRGILEDVLVKVEDFYFPVDFIILDMEGVDDMRQTPIILGRPFLATANACINCRTGAMDVSFGNRKMRLNIFHAAMGPAGDEASFEVDFIQDLVEAEHVWLLSDPPQEEVDESLEGDCHGLIESQTGDLSWTWHFEPLPELAEKPARPSIESPPELELKPLPASLKYAFLGKDQTLPVIISADLTDTQECQLLQVCTSIKRRLDGRWQI